MRSQQGYGLIVIAALFTAFSVMIAAAIDRDAIVGEINRQKEVSGQLSRLSLALARYAKFNGDRFPCPASYLVLPTNASFGAAAAATCYTGTGAAPAGTRLTGSVIIGMVPVKELAAYGVSLSDAFDPWGSRIIYAVHRDATSGATAVIVEGDRLAVTDYVTGQDLDPRPDMLLISYGRDRVGGRLRTQTTLTNPAISDDCTGGQRRHNNCDSDLSFIRGPLFTSSQAAATTYFDDTVSAYRYMAVAAPVSCDAGGVSVNGYCWYASATRNGCDVGCSTHGGYNSNNTWGDTPANCETIAIALNSAGSISVPSTTPTGSFAVGTSMTYPVGCVVRPGVGIYYDLYNPSSETGMVCLVYRRICACNN